MPFPTSCSPRRKSSSSWGRAAAFVFLSGNGQDVFGHPATRSDCAIAYWGIAIASGPMLVGPFDAARSSAGWRPSQGRAVGARRARARLARGVEGVLQGLRTRSTRMRAPAATSVRWRRSRRSSRATSRRRSSTPRASTRPSITSRWIRCSRPSSPGAVDKNMGSPCISNYLIHSYDFAPIAKKGVPLQTSTPGWRRPLPTRNTCVPHLFDGRPVGEVDRVESEGGRRQQQIGAKTGRHRKDLSAGFSRVGFHGVCPSPAGPGRARSRSSMS